MDELITLNQLKEYDAAKTNILNNQFDNVCNYVNDQINVVDNNVLNLSNYVNNVHNELNEAYNNFGTDNLVANNAQINSLNVIDIIANGFTGTDGQVLGKENGNVNWVNIPDPIDADNFAVNNITINNSATLNGFSIPAMTIMVEDDYNNLGKQINKSLFYFTTPNGNLYLRGYGYSPNVLPPALYSVYVNLRFLNKQMETHSLNLCEIDVTNNLVNGSSIYGVKADNEWNNSYSIGLNTYGNVMSTNADKLFIYNARFMYAECSNLKDTFISNHSLISGATEDYDPLKYCTDMSYMFNGCYNFNQPVNIGNNVILLDNTFNFCNRFNQPVNIPESVTSAYGFLMNCHRFNQPVNIGNNVTTLEAAFYKCYNFNQSITIPDSVSQLYATFGHCNNLNKPVYIGNSVTNMASTFSGCTNFNQPIIIPDSVTNMSYTFEMCQNLNQPVTIGNNVTDLSCAFKDCSKFNQSINIPNSVMYMTYAFQRCDALAASSVPIHISSSIRKGDTSNYIYNMLVNGGCGIPFARSRILNDL